MLIAVISFYVLLASSIVSAVPSRTTHQPTKTATSNSQSPTATVAQKNPKRGVPFAAGDSPGDINNINQTASVISWQYNWANIPPAYIATSNINFIPMQWGTGAIDGFVDAVRAQGADTILGFNEPDFYNEANMEAEEAAHQWMRFIEPLKQYGVRLGGPAVTGSSSALPWLEKFFQACSNCTIDFLPLHWYGSGTSGFYDHLWTMHNAFPKYPIWVTEYADTSSNDTEVFEFMNATLTYLDSLEWIERYAWFGFFRPKPDVHYSLLREDGGLNALGELYTGAKTVHTENITNTAFVGYKTMNGADRPSQPLVTTWAALASGAFRGWNILGASGFSQLTGLVAILTGSFIGAAWTLW